MARTRKAIKKVASLFGQVQRLQASAEEINELVALVAPPQIRFRAPARKKPTQIQSRERAREKKKLQEAGERMNSFDVILEGGRKMSFGELFKRVQKETPVQATHPACADIWTLPPLRELGNMIVAKSESEANLVTLRQLLRPTKAEGAFTTRAAPRHGLSHSIFLHGSHFWYEIPFIIVQFHATSWVTADGFDSADTVGGIWAVSKQICVGFNSVLDPTGVIRRMFCAIAQTSPEAPLVVSEITTWVGDASTCGPPAETILQASTTAHNVAGGVDADLYYWGVAIDFHVWSKHYFIISPGGPLLGIDDFCT